jgi:hypothetical protein
MLAAALSSRSPVHIFGSSSERQNGKSNDSRDRRALSGKYSVRVHRQKHGQGAIEGAKTLDVGGGDFRAGAASDVDHFRAGDYQKFCVRGRIDHHAVTNLSSNMMANWVFASHHSRGGIFHSPATGLRDELLNGEIFSRKRGSTSKAGDAITTLSRRIRR